MSTIKTWLAVWGLLLTYLMLLSAISHDEQEATCVSEIKDQYGHINYISGKIAPVSIN